MDLIDDKYEILQPLREGGMGAIYKVRHRLLDEVRVVKVMRPHASADPTLRNRFQREAKMAIRVRHPNIGQLFDYSIDESGTAVIVMEFIDGVTLQDVLRSDAQPSLACAVDIADQTLQALHCLHHNGIVHRDVSSDNVMLTRSFEGRLQVKLIDLGIAKDPGGEATATVSGTFLGKARYAAPEQFRGEQSGGATPASDLYSFGVLFYELLTGRLPIEGSSFAELATGHLLDPPTPFTVTDPDHKIPPGLCEAVLRALEKDPGQRIGSAREFAKSLEAFKIPGGSDPLELNRLLERARAASPPPTVTDEGLTARMSRQQAAPVTVVEQTGTQFHTVVEAMSVPEADPACLEILEVVNDYIVEREIAERQSAEQQRAAELAERERIAREAAERERIARDEATREAPPPPRRRRRTEQRERPSRQTRSAPGGIRPLHFGILGAVVIVLGVTGFAIWKAASDAEPALPEDPVATLFSTNMKLPEGSEAEVGRKLEAMGGLLRQGPGEKIRRQVEQERNRLRGLEQLYTHVTQLENVKKSVSGSGLDPDDVKRAVSDADLHWELLRNDRGVSGDDRAEALVVGKARDVLLDIARITDSDRLRTLAN